MDRPGRRRLGHLLRASSCAPTRGREPHRRSSSATTPARSDLLFQTSDTTWQAYNSYGGNSLYVGGRRHEPGRAYKVSYNRPFTTRGDDGGQDWVFNAEYPMVRWLEANGYDVSYTTGVDTDRAGAAASATTRASCRSGHDEYWSGEQRANVEAARNAGVNLAFFSGNEVFWKTRWENSIDGSGTPYRTLVCYKETHANAKIDPDADTSGPARGATRGSSPPATAARPGERADGHDVHGQRRRDDRHHGARGGRQDAILARHQHRDSGGGHDSDAAQRDPRLRVG